MAGSVHQYTAADPVVAQYEQWTYPPPINDLRDPTAAAYVASFSTLEKLAPIYWPLGQPKQALDVLVAGCGTRAAACYAFLNPMCNVTGIDISETSLGHEQKLKNHHRLDNLTLAKCPIEEVGSLGKRFDFIACQGVLHHMPDPTEGLRALGEVLRTDGIIAIMVYAKYGRAAVYMFQDLFRVMGLEQTPGDVAIVRETLAHLAPDHPLQNYLTRATDLNDDAGLVDTFLHRRDRSYNVPDCLSLVQEAGLVFQGWDRNYFYYPEGIFSGATALRQRLEQLADPQLWHAVELAFGALGTHHFHVCRPDRNPATYRIPWESEALMDCVPMKAARLGRRIDGNGRTQWEMSVAGVPPVLLSDMQAAVLSHVNGQRTISECLAASGALQNGRPRLEIARECFRLLWRTGFGIIRPPAGKRAAT